METPKQVTRFSNAWTDRSGKPKEGVKIRDLKKKPAYTPQPLRGADRKPEESAYGKKGDN